jgi:uncharacterized protein YjiS (DUF1127 family)
MQNILHFLALSVEPSDRRPGRHLLLTLALWHHRHRSRRQLALLDARELRDIGLSRADQRAECEKPFWQA